MINEAEPNLAAALERVADTVTRSLNATGKADQRRWRISLLFLTIGGPLLFALTLALSFQQGTIHQQEHLIKRGISCLLADQDDHRTTNKFAHDQMAKALHIEINQTDAIPLSEVQSNALKIECQSFIQEAVGEGIGPDIAKGQK